MSQYFGYCHCCGDILYLEFNSNLYMFFKEVSYAHDVCCYFIRNAFKTEIPFKMFIFSEIAKRKFQRSILLSSVS